VIRQSSKPDDFVAVVLEQMAPAGHARARRMFGGHGIYLEERFVAIVLGGKLYLKASRATRHEFESRNLEPLVFRMKTREITAQYFEAPPEVFDESQEMIRWLELARSAAAESKRIGR
jgi:DNA transformation protein